MRRRVIAALAVAAVLAVAGLGATAPREIFRLRVPASSARGPLLALYNGSFSRADPRTLARFGPLVGLGRHTRTWSFSPNRTRLVFGSELAEDCDSVGSLRFANLLRMRGAGDLRVGGAYVAALAWARADRLVAVTGTCSPLAYSAALVDPLSRRILARVPIAAGSIWSGAFAPDGLVLLLAPATGTTEAEPKMGPARLVYADSDGGVHTLTLDRILIGTTPGATQNQPGERRQAGLAVDPGGRAFVVGAGEPVAEIDLASMTARYHEIAQPTSLLRRVARWLEPDAQAKGWEGGPIRAARWLGGGQIAVFGRDVHAYFDGQGRPQSWDSAAGVTVLDTHSWTLQTLDPRATDLALGGGLLVTSAALWNTVKRNPSGTGLTGYTPDGRSRFHLFGHKAVTWLQMFGSRAYVESRDGRSTSVVDLRRGRVARVLKRKLPLLLTPDSSPYFG